MSIETGGPAFPRSIAPGQWGNASEGMTLRDYFAAQAIPQLMVFHGERLAWAHKHIAAEAYNIADAMLEARNKE